MRDSDDARDDAAEIAVDGPQRPKFIEQPQIDRVAGQEIDDVDSRRSDARETHPRSITVRRVRESWSGRTPSPADCERFERLAPGYTERILDEVDREARHRRRTETTGQWMGFSVAMIFFGGALGCVASGHEVVGGIFGTVDIVALVSIFALGRRNERIHVRESGEARDSDRHESLEKTSE